MKFLIRCIPTLLLLAGILAVASHGQESKSPADEAREQEIQAIRQELSRLSARLDQLEAASNVPAGISGIQASSPVVVAVTAIGEADYLLNRAVSQRLPLRVVMTGVLQRGKATAIFGLAYWSGTKQGGW